MLSTPPKTGNATLDAFLQEVYLKSLELEEKTIPEEGWSLTDLRSDLSEVISDKRDLIDIVTKYDDLKVYSEAISAQKAYLDSILIETRRISEHSQWFAEIMEWWDQNYRVIQDSKSAMASAADASDHADAAKISETNAKASETAAATSATEAKTSETNADTKATQASTSATNAKTSETNAKASETAAEGYADNAAASAMKIEQDVVKTAADREAVENAATSATWEGDTLNILGTTSPSLRGPKGDKGDQGDTGPEGPEGPKGDQGPTGLTGARGPQGPEGPKGDTGPEGPEGPKGDQGPEGPEGPKGDPGQDGASTWEAIQGKPTEFPPETHTHIMKQVDGLEEALANAGGPPVIVSTTPPEDTDAIWVNPDEVPPPLVTEPSSWDDLTGKPTEFPPETHTHSQYATTTQVNGRPALFSGAGAPPASIPHSRAGDWWLNESTMELHKITGV